MDEINMILSGIVKKDGRKIARVSFLRNKDFAEGILPDCEIVSSEGFDEDEIEQLKIYLKLNSEDLMSQAKKINPFRGMMK